MRMRRRITLLALMALTLSVANPALGAQNTAPGKGARADMMGIGPVIDTPTNITLSQALDDALTRGLTEVTVDFGTSGESKLVLRYEPGRPSPLTVNSAAPSPDFSVGLGWYIYVYLDRGDWEFLAGLGYAGATAALCAWLTPTIVGAVGCGVIAYVIGYFVIKWSAPSPGYCRELRFTYSGVYVGSKLVKRSC